MNKNDTIVFVEKLNGATEIKVDILEIKMKVAEIKCKNTWNWKTIDKGVADFNIKLIGAEPLLNLANFSLDHLWP